MLSEGGDGDDGDDWDDWDDGDFPCEKCCDYIGGLMLKSWININAALVMATVNQIDALARATQPEGETAEVKIHSLRSVECIVIGMLYKVARPEEYEAALDIMRGHIRKGLDQLQKQEKRNAKRQRTPAPGNGGGHDRPQ
jgi:hypothetical protein